MLVTADSTLNTANQHYQENASKMGLPVPLWIDNAEVVSTIQFPVTNASSGQVVHTAYGASPEIAIAAVDSAQKAFLNWTKTTPWERRELFLAAARDLLLRKDEVAALLRVCLSFSTAARVKDPDS